MKPCVLDSSAVIVFLEDAPGACNVQALLQKAQESRQALLMSVINWGEVYYAVWRLRGRQVAERKLEELSNLPIEVVDVDRATTELAASLKAGHKLPYVDSFAAATALLAKATLVTADRDFERVRQQVEVVWVSEL